jgi:Predicted chitinase
VIADDSFSKGPRELPPFLANVLHETGRLRRMEESLDYSAKRLREIGLPCAPGTRWRRAALAAEELKHDPEALAEVLYGGRYGNTQSGDGFRFRGRGPGQITFRANYQRVGDIVGQDLEGVPDLAAQQRFGIEIFLAWWEDKVPDDYIGNAELVRRVVNGGKIGLEDVRLLTVIIERTLPGLIA